LIQSNRKSSISVLSSVAISVATDEELLQFAWIGERNSGCACDSLNVLDISQLGGVALETLSLFSSTGHCGPGTDNTGMDCARDTVSKLDIDLWQNEVVWIIGVVVFDISPGRQINHLPHLETLNSFVLWHTSGAVDAPHDVGVSLVFLRSSVVSSLGWHILLIIKILIRRALVLDSDSDSGSLYSTL